MATGTNASTFLDLAYLKGKAAIVTGASRGLGRAIALRLAQGGARLVLTARSEGAMEDTARDIRAMGAEFRLVATPDGDPEPVVAAATSAFGAPR